jgi:hypothetical protein
MWSRSRGQGAAERDQDGCRRRLDQEPVRLVWSRARAQGRRPEAKKVANAPPTGGDVAGPWWRLAGGGDRWGR